MTRNIPIFEKKKFLIIGVCALIISILINFPHLVNIISSPERPPFIPNGFLPPNQMEKPRVDGDVFMAFQFGWYFILAFILMCITSYRPNNITKERKTYLIIMTCVIMVISIFYVSENIILRSLRDNFSFYMRKHSFDAVLMSRYLFVLVLSILTTLLIRMMQRQTDMAVENERLRTENLQIRYNALSNQMNPHFFFNSLNSLQYLLMDNQQQKSIIYIEELSKVFRYILQSSKKELVSLQEEIDFLNSYRFLLNIRFEDKIRFEIEIDESYLNCELPVLTIQPLVENAINHNSCSMSKPLIIRIYIDNNCLIVSNNIIPKLRDNKGTGIGLDNLNNRSKLLMNKPIEIAQNDGSFKVAMPLKTIGLHNH